MTLQQQANQSFENRRRWLQAAGASAATLWLPRSAWSQPRWAANPFTLGVASGAATPSSVLLWTRLHLPGVAAASLGSDPITVRWELADDEGFRRISRCLAWRPSVGTFIASWWASMSARSGVP